MQLFLTANLPNKSYTTNKYFFFYNHTTAFFYFFLNFAHNKYIIMLLSKRILPAEWEPQDGVMITWPNADTDWAPYLTEITQTYLALAKTIAQHEKLIIAAQNPDDVQKSLSKALSKEELARVSIFPCPINDTWARDHGPITVRDTADGSASARLQVQRLGREVCLAEGQRHHKEPLPSGCLQGQDRGSYQFRARGRFDRE